MESRLILKKTRNDKGYTIKHLSEVTGFKPNILRYYESGDRSLDAVMVYKVLRLFEPLNLNPENVFDYKKECDKEIAKWQTNHPRNFDYVSLRHQSYEKIMHLKYRKSITEEQFDKLMYYYRDTFDYLSVILDDEKILSVAEYEDLYLRFLYISRMTLYLTGNEPEPQKTLLEAYLNCEYSSYTFSFLTKDFSNIIGYHKIDKLREILSGKMGLDNLSIKAALKLCYVLDVDFNSIFKLVKKTTL